MREIKFRAWDKELECFPTEIYSAFTNHNPRFILEQYTGLKDKNGKEIYEGDIVKYYNDNLEVSLDVFRFWLKGEKFGFDGDDLVYPEDCLIIGNIHENTELLS